MTEKQKKWDVVKFDVDKAELTKLEFYKELTVSGPMDDDGFKAVHSARMVVKNHRVGIDKREKELKEDANKWRKLVGDRAKELRAILEPIESHLTAQEKIVTDEKKRQEEEAARLFQEKIDERVMTLSNYSTDRFNANIPYQKIATMSDEEWHEYHSKVMQAWNEHQERIVEEKRIETERKVAEDAARKAEDERLAKIRAEQEKQMAEIKAEQEKIEAEKAKIQAEKDKAEREAVEKQIAENARIQAIADEKARVEREKKEAEEKAAAEKAEAERVAALMPDKERAIKWVESMRELIPKRPAIKDNAIASMIVVSLDRIKSILDELHRDIEEA